MVWHFEDPEGFGGTPRVADTKGLCGYEIVFLIGIGEWDTEHTDDTEMNSISQVELNMPRNYMVLTLTLT